MPVLKSVVDKVVGVPHMHTHLFDVCQRTGRVREDKILNFCSNAVAM
jgi:hypothetical protein